MCLGVSVEDTVTIINQTSIFPSQACFVVDMFLKVSPWTMFFLGILIAAAENRSGKTISNVVQKPVISGINFTCRCSFPFTVNVSNLTVFWWKDGNRGFLKEDSRKIFMIRAGGAYLHLLNVTVSDAGTYYCLAKQAGRTVADGTGEQLVVYSVPSPLKIVSVRSRNAATHFLKLQCRTAAFYPKEFNLTWHRNGSIIQSGFRHEQHSTADGLYEVISSLDEKRAVKEGTVYTCKIIHRSMLTPATANYTVPHEAVEGLSASLIAGSIGGAVLILTFIVIVVMTIIFRGAKKRTVITNRTQSWEEGENVSGNLMYAHLDLVRSKEYEKPEEQVERPVYAKIAIMAAADNELAYASLNTSSSKKNLKRQNKEISVIYSGVKNNN